MIRVASDRVSERIKNLIRSTIPDYFLKAAKELLVESRTPEKVIAACLMDQSGANVAGGEIQGCSLLTGQSEYVSCLVCCCKHVD